MAKKIVRQTKLPSVSRRTTEAPGRLIKPRILSGLITYANNKPAAGLALWVYQKGFRKNILLKKTETDSQGRYRVEYSNKRNVENAIIEEEKIRVDLYIAVFVDAPDSARSIRQTSPVQFNVPAQAKINLMLSMEKFPFPSLYEDLQATLASFLKKQKIKFSELSLEDINYLAGSLAVQAYDLRCFLLSHMIAQAVFKNKRSNLSTDTRSIFCFALLKRQKPQASKANQGVAVQDQVKELFTDILDKESAVIEQQITESIKSYLIPVLSKVKLARLFALWRTHRIDKRLDAPRLTSGLSTRRLLNSVGVRSESKAHDYVRLSDDFNGESEAFLDAVSKAGILNNVQTERLRFKFQLEEISFGDPSFAEFLIALLDVQDPKALARIDKSKLLTLMKRHGVSLPGDLPGHTNEEKLRALLCLLEYYFAEAYIKQNLRDHGFPGLQGMIAKDKKNLESEIETFLKNNPLFEFTQGFHQQDKRDKNGRRGLNMTKVDETLVVPYLEKITRVSRITSRASEIRVLLNDGLNSANKIYRMGRQKFVNTYASVFGDARADDVFEASEAIASTSLSVFMHEWELRSQPFATLRDPGLVSPTIEIIAREFPEWEKLFGSLSTCACADCESVLSPAAYLLHLFKFLDSDAFSNDALPALFNRRSDLRFIRLNCENTNTELPYIDIANELMEEYVATGAANWQKQTTRSAHELTVMPEHLNRSAYTKLYQSYNTNKLPFLLELEEGRAYLNGLKLDRLELVTYMTPVLDQDSLFQNQDWVMERLRINPKEMEIFSLTTRPPEPTLWGEPNNASWWRPLQKFSVFLDKTGLNSRQAYALLDLKSMNPSAELKVQVRSIGTDTYSPGDECDLDKMVIAGNGSEFKLFLQQVYLLLRLQKITEWTYYELDEYLLAKNGDVDLQEVAQLLELKQHTGLSVYQVLVLFFSFSDESYLNYNGDRVKPIHSFAQKVFDHIDSAGNAQSLDLDVSLNQQGELLMKGCGISAAELDEIVATNPSILPTDKLSLSKVAYLYRVAIFIRSLNISVSDYVILHAKFGKDPITEYNDHGPAENKGSPRNALEFIRIVRLLQASAIGTNELAYVLSGQLPADQNFISAATDIDSFLAGIIDEINLLYGEQPVLPDQVPAVPTTEQTLIEYMGLTFETALALLCERFAEKFGVPLSVIRGLVLRHYFDSPDTSIIGNMILLKDESTESVLDARRLNYRLFAKLGILTEGLKLSESLLLFLVSSSADAPSRYYGDLIGCYSISAGVQDENYQASLSEVETLWTLAELASSHRVADDNLLDSLRQLLDYDSATLPAGMTKQKLRTDFYDAYEAILSWNKADLEYLLGARTASVNTGSFGLGIPLPLAYPDGNISPDSRALIPLLARLYQIKSFSARFSYSVQQLHQWCSNTPAGIRDTALSAINAYTRDVSDQVWRKQASELRNTLREQQRDTLVAYLLRKWKLSTSEQLYEAMLIDVQMSACRNTSRIKSAISSTQLFISRTLMNLEQVQASAEASLSWKWMKQYRVWEAKQKVFFFPENYIVPHLLDTKTPLLVNLENDILKNEINESNAKEAIITYLEDFSKIARLQICGVYEEQRLNYTGPKPVSETVLHVFARTWEQPQKYYYRQRDPCHVWTAWQEVDADLEGDQLIPVVYNGRMYVFWPEINQEVDDLGELIMKKISDGIGQALSAIFSLFATIPNMMQASLAAVAGVLVPALRSASTALTEANENLATGFLVPDELITALDETVAFLQGIVDQSEAAGEEAQSINIEDFLPNISNIFETIYNVLPKKRWKIQLAWCEERQGKWSGKKITGAYIEFEDLAGAHYDKKRSFLFSGNIRSHNDLNKIVVVCSLHRNVLNLLSENQLTTANTTEVIGTFILEDRLSPFIAVQEPKQFDARAVLEQFAGDVASSIGDVVTALQNQGHPVSAADQDMAIIKIKVDDAPDSNVLPAGYRESFNIDGQEDQFWYQLIAPHQYPIPFESGSYLHPFFYQDSRNSYIVDRNNLTPAEIIKALQEFKHPFVSHFVARLDSLNLDGFFSLQTQSLNMPAGQQALLNYKVDFDLLGSYTQYNWELFFHTPFIIADKLRQNQKYEEALDWINHIFSPSSINDSAPVPNRFWITKPFFDATSEDYRKASLRNILGLDNGDSTSNARKELQCLVDKLVEQPFNVHLIARYRTTAYQKAVIMLYLDILIEWADHLFRQYTIETITEAFSLYVLALTILGKRPEILPPQERAGRSYAELSGGDTEDNLIERQETLLLGQGRESTLVSREGLSKAEIFKTLNCLPSPKDQGKIDSADKDKDKARTIAEALSSGYFCLPYNKKLFAYWDILDDRMYKIRHCLNIKGELQSLSLFQPEIDPTLLVNIAAQGGDILAAVAFFAQPAGHYRFEYMLQKAFDLCTELKSLGGALLSAIEKGDAEQLALLRNSHELAMIEQVAHMKQMQVDEAKLSIEALDKQVETTTRRKNYYEKNLSEVLNLFEQGQLTLNLSSIVLQTLSSAFTLAAAAGHLIPEIKGGFVTTLGASYGGRNVGEASKAVAEGMGVLSGILNSVSSLIGTMGSYHRRAEDWTLQDDVLGLELEHLEIQKQSANKRLQISQKDLDNQGLQQQQSRELRDYMENKYSNAALYDWHLNEVSKLFFSTYQLVFDLARQAEKAFQFELGIKSSSSSSSSYIGYDRWDSLRRGLLCGEHLYADLRKLESAYNEQNTRVPELTKNFSLKRLNPLALLSLRMHGSCDFSIPEFVFDMDHPGQYFRRIKSVALSIPCIVGPYTGVHAKLRLLSNEIRNTKSINGGYLKDPDPNVEDRFTTNVIGVNSIATSSAQNDSGMFEFNLRDVRYLPFEGAGAISTWKLELPEEIRQFDYGTISDVILHMNYTAIDGGEQFRADVNDSLKFLFTTASTESLVSVFSIKHDFPQEWHLFSSAQAGNSNQVTLDVKREHFPYYIANRDLQVKSISFGFLGGDVFPIKLKKEGESGLLSAGSNQSPLATIDNLSSTNQINVAGRNLLGKWLVSTDTWVGVEDVFVYIVYELG